MHNDSSCFKSCLPDCQFMELVAKAPVRDYSKELGAYVLPSGHDCYEGNTQQTDWLQNLPCEYQRMKDETWATNEIHPALEMFFEKYRLSYQVDNGQAFPNVIRIFTESPTGLQMVLTSSTTFVGMLSNIGGTMGLFAGFSLLSAVEVIYWIYRCFSRKRKMH